MKVLFFDRNLRKKWIANKEEKKDEIIPIIVGKISIADNDLNKVTNSTRPEIEIAGIPTRKESLAAVSLSIPENRAEVKVIPDLETPGNIARDWARPKKIISFKLISSKSFLLLPKISARAKNSPMRIEVNAMENKLLKSESE